MKAEDGLRPPEAQDHQPLSQSPGSWGQAWGTPALVGLRNRPDGRPQAPGDGRPLSAAGVPATGLCAFAPAAPVDKCTGEEDSPAALRLCHEAQQPHERCRLLCEAPPPRTGSCAFPPSEARKKTATNPARRRGGYLSTVSRENGHPIFFREAPRDL